MRRWASVGFRGVCGQIPRPPNNQARPSNRRRCPSCLDNTQLFPEEGEAPEPAHSHKGPRSPLVTNTPRIGEGASRHPLLLPRGQSRWSRVFQNRSRSCRPPPPTHWPPSSRPPRDSLGQLVSQKPRPRPSTSRRPLSCRRRVASSHRPPIGSGCRFTRLHSLLNQSARSFCLFHAALCP